MTVSSELGSVKSVEALQVAEAFGDGDEQQVANEQDVWRHDGLFQIAPFVTKVHEDQNDVCSFYKRHHDECPFDGRPSECFRPLEEDTHADLHSRDEGQEHGHHPDFFANGRTRFFAVVRRHGVAVVDNEIVAFHVR